VVVLNKNNKLSLLGLCVCAVGVLSLLPLKDVRANERLNYTHPLPQSSLLQIDRYMQRSANTSANAFNIAKADLNSDGLYEFIAKTKDCDTASACTFNILAETQKGVISLGHMQGKTLLLGNEYHHGIRSLIVYENGHNDYDHTLYTWKPNLSAYRKSGS